ncbi:hypothetical protein Caka_0092 [Coraliomargarita akajimensis DSM 45221]|uniref:Ricin B lectin n=2 Tax=Coraliomargarita TaxID=442430 RepID=D5EL19_CORAD|nr:hypothetical protein Caka_0092 [Coraliomargarita akajimensis DSM 45221]
MMKMKTLVMLLCAAFVCLTANARPYFNTSTDLLLCQYDSKPDPDDIHAQAAAGCMLAHADHSNVNYYAVQGAYGTQQGNAFIDSTSLFNMAFGTKNVDWTDAHNEWWNSVGRIRDKVTATLNAGGKVWVAEAGQSNITADWIHEVLKTVPAATVKSNVIVVQHSQWNEDHTAASDLSYVKSKATYYAIDDGNAPWGSTTWGDRGIYSTPQYNNASTTYLAQAKSASNPNTVAKNLWTEADYICDNQPYHPDWSNITPGGVDFSDTVEIWWILNVQDAGNNQDGFWAKYVTNTPSADTGLIGKTVAFKALANNQYICADRYLNATHWYLAANRTSVGAWEKFLVVDAGSGLVAFKASGNGKYVCADQQLDAINWKLAANRTSVGAWEKFTIINNSDGTVSLKANGNGKYICADKGVNTNVPPLLSNRTAIGAWEKFTVEVQ